MYLWGHGETRDPHKEDALSMIGRPPSDTITQNFKTKRAMQKWINQMQSQGWALVGAPSVGGMGVGLLKDFTVTMQPLRPVSVDIALAATGPGRLDGYTSMERWAIESIENLRRDVQRLRSEIEAIKSRSPQTPSLEWPGNHLDSNGDGR
jgi:hypothetical protein